MTRAPLEWETVKSCRAVVPRRVVYRRLVTETVLLNIETGLYHGMDDVGSRFFRALQESESVRAAVDVLVEEFDAPEERIREDMLGYCSDLLERGLLELEEPENRST